MGEISKHPSPTVIKGTLPTVYEQWQLRARVTSTLTQYTLFNCVWKSCPCLPDTKFHFTEKDGPYNDLGSFTSSTSTRIQTENSLFHINPNNLMAFGLFSNSSSNTCFFLRHFLCFWPLTHVMFASRWYAVPNCSMRKIKFVDLHLLSMAKALVALCDTRNRF